MLPVSAGWLKFSLAIRSEWEDVVSFNMSPHVKYFPGGWSLSKRIPPCESLEWQNMGWYVPSSSLACATRLSRDALPQLCAKHGASREDFRELTARYSVINRENHIVVTTRDTRGRRRIREYVGSPARRVRILDPTGPNLNKIATCTDGC